MKGKCAQMTRSGLFGQALKATSPPDYNHFPSFSQNHVPLQWVVIWVPYVLNSPAPCSLWQQKTKCEENASPKTKIKIDVKLVRQALEFKQKEKKGYFFGRRKKKLKGYNQKKWYCYQKNLNRNLRT